MKASMQPIDKGETVKHCCMMSIVIRNEVNIHATSIYMLFTDKVVVMSIMDNHNNNLQIMSCTIFQQDSTF